METLRVLSYLAPSIPESLFESIARGLEARIGIPVSLGFETRVSGPAPDSDPFAADLADLAFVCAPSYPLLKEAGSPVELLPVAPVFAEPRAEGRPVYFADVVVGARNPLRAFADLRGAVWSYNDRYSRSGWQGMLARLAEIGHDGEPESFFGGLIQAGSHLRSIELVAGGQADAAAIDSNTLWLVSRRDPALAARLGVIESWGPLPIQPLLVRSTLDPALKERIAQVLLSLPEDPELSAELEPSGLSRFARVQESDYAAIPSLGIPRGARPAPGRAEAEPTPHARNRIPSVSPER